MVSCLGTVQSHELTYVQSRYDMRILVDKSKQSLDIDYEHYRGQTRHKEPNWQTKDWWSEDKIPSKTLKVTLKPLVARVSV